MLDTNRECWDTTTRRYQCTALAPARPNMYNLTTASNLMRRTEGLDDCAREFSSHLYTNYRIASALGLREMRFLLPCCSSCRQFRTCWGQIGNGPLRYQVIYTECALAKRKLVLIRGIRQFELFAQRRVASHCPGGDEIEDGTCMDEVLDGVSEVIPRALDVSDSSQDSLTCAKVIVIRRISSRSLASHRLCRQSQSWRLLPCFRHFTAVYNADLLATRRTPVPLQQDSF